MKIHELKLHYSYYDLVAGEEKTFEVRKDDRGFQVGDALHLREWIDEKDWVDGSAKQKEGFTERSCIAKITCILHEHEGITEGYVVLGITLLHRT